MRPFTFVRPSAADEAVRAVAGDPEAVFLAGSTNLVDHLRLGVAAWPWSLMSGPLRPGKSPAPAIAACASAPR